MIGEQFYSGEILSDQGSVCVCRRTGPDDFAKSTLVIEHPNFQPTRTDALSRRLRPLFDLTAARLILSFARLLSPWSFENQAGRGGRDVYYVAANHPLGRGKSVR